MKLLIITQKVDQDDDILGFFHNWLTHIAENVDSLSVITLFSGKNNLPKNTEVFSLGKERGFLKFVQAIRFYFFLLKILPKVDGVFVHMAPEYVRAVYPVNIFFRKPIIMWYAHIKVSPTARWAIGKVDKIFTPSKESFSFGSEKVISTGHGIDPDIFKPMRVVPERVPVIMTMSRISKVKRLHVFIEALNIFKNNHPDLVFRAIIVGGPARKEDYEYEMNLRKLADSYGLAPFVEWIGGIKNIETPILYNKASVFVRLQGGGGFGKTELEAMACGIPAVLCTDVHSGVLGDFSRDLYFEEDNAEMCAEKISNVLKWSDAQKSAYGELSRNIVVKNHNINNLAKRIADEFSKMQKA